MDKLVQPISQSPQREWILDTVADLPEYYEARTAKIPKLARDVDGFQSLAELDSWIRHGANSLSKDDTNLPSIMVGPLVVLIQLTQYWRYLEQTNANNTQATDLQADLVAQHQSQAGAKVEILGFCAGLLAALAVASAKSRQEFQEYGAVAVRLAMLIGGLIDAQEAWDKGSGKGGLDWACASTTPEISRAKDQSQETSILGQTMDDAFNEVAKCPGYYAMIKYFTTSGTNVDSSMLNALVGCILKSRESLVQLHSILVDTNPPASFVGVIPLAVRSTALKHHMSMVKALGTLELQHRTDEYGSTATKLSK
ncbi:hypothetical protein N7501_003440 [Penicillium viridicatum]|nr:hypothetical protein N7501_003440 [Penicillium viridicatum]